MRKKIVDIWVENNGLWLTDETGKTYQVVPILCEMTPIKNPPPLRQNV